MSELGDSHQRLILMPSGRRGDVERGVTVLQAARNLGVELESICGGRRTCGRCLVHVETGTFLKHGITSDTAHLTEPDKIEMEYAAKRNLDLSKQRLACGAGGA